MQLSSVVVSLILVAFVAPLIVDPVNAKVPAEAMPPGVFPSDVNYLECEACQRAVRQLTRVVRAARAQLESTPSGSEQLETMTEPHPDVEEAVTGICARNSRYGRWLKRTRVLQRDTVLRLADSNEEDRRCGDDCQTVEAACLGSFKYANVSRTQIAQYLWRESHAEDDDRAIRRICHRWTKVCSTPEVLRVLGPDARAAPKQAEEFAFARDRDEQTRLERGGRPAMDDLVEKRKREREREREIRRKRSRDDYMDNVDREIRERMNRKKEEIKESIRQDVLRRARESVREDL